MSLAPLHQGGHPVEVGKASGCMRAEAAPPPAGIVVDARQPLGFYPATSFGRSVPVLLSTTLFVCWVIRSLVTGGPLLLCSFAQTYHVYEPLAVHHLLLPPIELNVVDDMGDTPDLASPLLGHVTISKL